MPKTKVDLSDFALRVERVCDFFLDKTERDGSDDVLVIQKLKDDAADIQFDITASSEQSLEGLDKYMRGLNDLGEGREAQ